MNTSSPTHSITRPTRLRSISSTRTLARLVPLILGLLCLFVTAQAQIQVGFKLPKTEYVAGEPVIGTITIINQTGGELDLKDQNKAPWVSINVVKYDGGDLSPIGVLTMPPIKIPTGKATSASINVSKLYGLQNEGMYRIVAVVHYFARDEAFQSAKAFLTIRKGSSVWSQTVGIPKGLPGAGGNCRFSVLTMDHTKGSDVYVKLENPSSGQVVACERLGAIMRQSRPEVKLDSQNRVHVLFLNTPLIYVHFIVDTSGKISKPFFYKRSQSSIASLNKDSSGGVIVSGGVAFDPKADKEATRGASERPF